MGSVSSARLAKCNQPIRFSCVLRNRWVFTCRTASLFWSVHFHSSPGGGVSACEREVQLLSISSPTHPALAGLGVLTKTIVKSMRPCVLAKLARKPPHSAHRTPGGYSQLVLLIRKLAAEELERLELCRRHSSHESVSVAAACIVVCVLEPATSALHVGPDTGLQGLWAHLVPRQAAGAIKAVAASMCGAASSSTTTQTRPSAWKADRGSNGSLKSAECRRTGWPRRSAPGSGGILLGNVAFRVSGRLLVYGVY